MRAVATYHHRYWIKWKWNLFLYFRSIFLLRWIWTLLYCVMLLHSQSIIHPDIINQICIRFGHMDNFEFLPGSIYSMKVLESWNLEMPTNINGERDYFSNLSLFDYPGEHVGNLSTTVLKLFKITQQGFATPVDLGPKKSQSVWYLLCLFKLTGLYSLGQLLNIGAKIWDTGPEIILQDYEYPTYGPVVTWSILHH